MSQGFSKGIPIDTDTQLAANSQFVVPSQAAVKAYVQAYQGSANNASYLGGVQAANYVVNSDSRILSGNLTFTASNVSFTTGFFAGNATVNSIFFANAGYTPTEGQMSWNSDESTLNLGLSGNVSILQVGQEVLYRVKNQTGVTIPNGTVVMANGTLGSSGRIKVTPAIANGSVPSQYIMGIATETIVNGGDGYVTHFGKVRGINTTAFLEGDVLYADPAVPGGLTRTKPKAPNSKTIVALVIHSGVNGVLFVRPTYGSNLNDDENVEITAAANNDMLVYRAANGRFENTRDLNLNTISMGTSNVSINTTAFRGNVVATTISGNLTGNVVATTISGNLTGNVAATTVSASANVTVGTEVLINTSVIQVGNSTVRTIVNTTAFTGNVVATSISGNLTGNVVATTISGNLTGNVAATTISGNLTGNVAATTISGNLTGNVAATTVSATANVTVGSNVLINTSAFSLAGNNTTAPTMALTGSALNIGNTSITGAPQVVLSNTSGTTVINTNFISTTSISGNLTGNVVATTISGNLTGNVSATTISGNLTGNVLATTVNASSYTIGADFTANSTQVVTPDLLVTGNLIVNGTFVSLNVATLDVEDLNITVAKGTPSAAAANGAGLTVDGANATLLYISAGNTWLSNVNFGVGNSTVNVSVNSTAFIGNVIATSISGNLTGNVVATSISGNLTGNVTATTISGNLTGNVAATTLSGNLTGNVAAITISGNLTGNVAATTLSGNLTGNVAAVTITGNLTGNVAAVTITGNLTGNVLATSVNTTTINATSSIVVGANVIVNTSVLQIGNSTVKTTVNSTAFIGNVVATSISGNLTGNVDATSISGNLTGTFISVSYANVSGQINSTTVYASGNVGIGVVPYTAGQLHVKATAPTDTRVFLENSGGSNVQLQAEQSVGSMGTSTGHGFNFYTNNTSRVFISADGNVGIGSGITAPSSILAVNGTVTAVDFNSTSDIRFKSNVVIIDAALDKVSQLNGYTFTLIETGERSTGLIAQEVEKVLPEAVKGIDKKTLSYGNLMGLLIEAVKEQSKRIERLESLLNK